MARFLRALIVAVVLVQTGIASIGVATCFESCPDDNDAGQCAPFCKCTTCGHPSFRSSLPGAILVVAVPPCRDLAGASLLAPVLPPLAEEIPHVPKAQLV